eukprot:CAMPEP_0170471934 /NCGR_PEP_ID=MMETSP0123-20130129/14061_1 /TAXON_ID=182087 /ORGANISM="Favella ehrenbergii, Strain Fehren 1" /LENGTH=71 /DNA_ID=CAMNT_0010739893 /DNA_START=363 /DNA_END=581 /DNA_ORIENTATION=+
MESMERVQQIDPGMLTCIDYIMAAAEYEDFVGLMLEFRDCNEEEVVVQSGEFMQLLSGGDEEEEKNENQQE